MIQIFFPFQSFESEINRFLRYRGTFFIVFLLPQIGDLSNFSRRIRSSRNCGRLPQINFGHRKPMATHLCLEASRRACVHHLSNCRGKSCSASALMSVHLTPGHTLRRLLQSQIYHSGHAWPVNCSDVTVRELCNGWVCFVFLRGFDGDGFSGR